METKYIIIIVIIIVIVVLCLLSMITSVISTVIINYKSSDQPTTTNSSNDTVNNLPDNGSNNQPSNPSDNGNGSNNQPSNPSDNGNGSNDQPSNPPNDGRVYGRYIRISQPTVGCLNIAEINVYSSDGGTNIAKNATITKSSSFGNDEYPVANLIDDNLNTFTHTSCTDAGWIQLDFGSPVPITHIVLSNRRDCCQGRLNGVILTILDASQQVVYTAKPITDKSGSSVFSYISTAGEPFNTYTYSPPDTTPVGSDVVVAPPPDNGSNNQPSNPQNDGRVYGRYIRISQPTVGCLNVAEINVRSSDGGANIAKNATITKSSSFGNDEYPVANLIDDNLNTFTHTSCTDAGWIQLDFGSLVPITNIVLSNRRDCCQGRLNGVILTILDASQQVVYTAKPIADKSGSSVFSYISVAGEPFYTYTYSPPDTTPVGSDVVIASQSPQQPNNGGIDSTQVSGATVQLVKSLSNFPCIKNQTYGINPADKYIWVSDKCQGTFKIMPIDKTFNCRSSSAIRDRCYYA